MPGSNSRPREVTSNQQGIHPRLADLVRRARAADFQRRVAHQALEKLAALEPVITQFDGVLLDSGCGTARSTELLAAANPQLLTLGIDKSRHRLSRQQKRTEPANMRLLRLDLVDAWRAISELEWPVKKHFLLYPNPWPKQHHVRRRWHAHAVFECLLGLADELELRTNWQIYAEEFATAVALLSQQNLPVEVFSPQTFLSPFEKKYSTAGQTLWRVCYSPASPYK